MQEKSAFGLLFDLSFSEFITTRIIKILFIIGVALVGLSVLFFIIGGFTQGFLHGIIFLCLSPIVFALYVLMIRVWCELIIVVFRIAENTSRLVEQNEE